MSISIGNDLSGSLTSSLTKATSTTASNLEQSLGSLNDATDEEMLDACKSFEAYFVEKLIDAMREMAKSDEEEENDYLAQFGNLQYQEYAKEIADSGQLGIAQMLYESMKRQ